MNGESRPVKAASEDLAGGLIYNHDKTDRTPTADTRRKPLALDTGTSSDAADKISAATRATVTSAILRLLSEHSATDDEISARYAERGGPDHPKVTDQRLRTARAALVRDGLVRDSGALAFSALGNRATLWEVSR